MRNLLYILVAVAASVSLLLAGGCISDDYSTSPSDRLDFSTNTISFDTVFTDVGTPTARLKVFNRAKKSILISRIAFRNPSSDFRLNVDGVSGSIFNDVEIRGGDSIFVFIECFIRPNQENEPFLVSDNLDFLTNGVDQSVEVLAWGQNVTRLRNVRVESDLTLTAERPYVVFDSLTVDKGATLRIEPGAKILFHDKGRLAVNGRIEAVGTPDKHIEMRGDRLDYVLPDAPYDILAGQWLGIDIAPESYGNRLEYVNMRSTTSGLSLLPGASEPDRLKISIVNSWLHNSQGSVFTAPDCTTESFGVCFSEAADAVVLLSGGSHRFSQCTFSNNYLFSIPTDPMVTMLNVFPDENAEGPPMKARFGNCIFYGLAPDLTPGDLNGADVLIEWSSLRSEGSNDDNFIDCFWGVDPLFMTVRQDYYFNYRLKPESPVIASGNPELTAPETAIDMYGVPRIVDGNPSLGAFQYSTGDSNKE